MNKKAGLDTQPLIARDPIFVPPSAQALPPPEQIAKVFPELGDLHDAGPVPGSPRAPGPAPLQDKVLSWMDSQPADKLLASHADDVKGPARVKRTRSAPPNAAPAPSRNSPSPAPSPAAAMPVAADGTSGQKSKGGRRQAKEKSVQTPAGASQSAQATGGASQSAHGVHAQALVAGGAELLVSSSKTHRAGRNPSRNTRSPSLEVTSDVDEHKPRRWSSSPITASPQSEPGGQGLEIDSDPFLDSGLPLNNSLDHEISLSKSSASTVKRRRSSGADSTARLFSPLGDSRDQDCIASMFSQMPSRSKFASVGGLSVSDVSESEEAGLDDEVSKPFEIYTMCGCFGGNGR